MSDVLVIIPAYNEGGNIRRTVEEVRSLALRPDILVVDDGSQDDTARLAWEAGAWVVSLPFNLGIGGAVQTGFRYAKECGYSKAVQVDGDGQHDARYVEKLLAPVVSGEADIAVGSRFIPPFMGYRSSFVRRIGIHFFAALISTLTGCRITDPTSGFRAFGQRAIELFADDYPPDYPEPESLMTARRRGLNLAEVPVEMRKRSQGHSSIRYLATLYYMIKVTFAVVLSMVKGHATKGHKDT
jgi:glycosyltransferase involved in cell wall biosynthesis